MVSSESWSDEAFECDANGTHKPARIMNRMMFKVERSKVIMLISLSGGAERVAHRKRSRTIGRRMCGWHHENDRSEDRSF